MGYRLRSKKKNQKGFTLIELIVVIVLLGLMFAFALPKMDGFLFSADADNVSRWIVLNVAELKSKSVKDQVRYSLNADSSENKFYISAETMDDGMMERAEKNGFRLPESLQLVDVIFPFEPDDDEPLTDIRFYKKGYSDNAIIHIESRDGERISYIIEPFLSDVTIKKGFVLFGQR